MRAEVYWIPGPWPGRLGILPRPRGGDWLSDEVRRWREEGLDVVVSLLTPDEIADLGLREEEALSREQGLEFQTFPIPDRGLPEARVGAIDLIGRLAKALESGKTVVIHCRQGIGRSALLTASLLVAAGQTAEGAFRRIEESRGIPVPETPAQRDWVRELEAEAAAVSVEGR